MVATVNETERMRHEDETRKELGREEKKRNAVATMNNKTGFDRR